VANLAVDNPSDRHLDRNLRSEASNAFPANANRGNIRHHFVEHIPSGFSIRQTSTMFSGAPTPTPNLPFRVMNHGLVSLPIFGALEVFKNPFALVGGFRRHCGNQELLKASSALLTRPSTSRICLITL
jgi:hypothetical protein